MAKKQKTPPDPIPKYRRGFTGAAVTAVLLGVFAVYLHIEQLSGASLDVFANTQGYTADWFLYCKELFFFCIACGILLYTLGERIFPDRPCRENPLFTKQARFPGICIGVYFLLTVLSAVCAGERSVVWQGNCAEYEGIMSLT
ncbi:MAG: hypothetical protein J6S92_01745, partial [Oscillospiraceae bacterium]|nr:hypothetical protein [Oscillospiraceae bacterium]